MVQPFVLTWWYSCYVASGFQHAQLRPYLHVAKRDALLRQTIAGLVSVRWPLVLKDPYANSFNNWGKLEGAPRDRPYSTLMAGFGNASTRWTRFAILCSWLISSGKRLARLASLMRLLSQRLRKFSIFGQWNKTTRTLLIVLSEIRTVRKTPW